MLRILIILHATGQPVGLRLHAGPYWDGDLACKPSTPFVVSDVRVAVGVDLVEDGLQHTRIPREAELGPEHRLELRPVQRVAPVLVHEPEDLWEGRLLPVEEGAQLVAEALAVARMEGEVTLEDELPSLRVLCSLVQDQLAHKRVPGVSIAYIQLVRLLDEGLVVERLAHRAAPRRAAPGGELLEDGLRSLAEAKIAGDASELGEANPPVAVGIELQEECAHA